MAEVTWIKLNTDMFDNKKIKQIRKMPGGNDMVLFWVMILTLAGKSNSQGYIFFTETLPYNAEMLANEFDMELNTVKMALEIFIKFNMITVEEETILITGWTDHQNAEGLEKIKEREQSKLRKRKQREREKLLQSPAKDETCSFKNEECDMSRDSHCDGMGDVPVTPYYIEVEGEIDNTTTPSTSENEPMDNFIDFFNNNMGHLMTPFELQVLQTYIDDGMDAYVITLALQEAVEKDAREMSYIKAILNRWLEHGLKIVEAVMADKRNFKNKKKQKETGRCKSPSYSSKKESTFNNFKQRDYDFDDLKKKLVDNQDEEEVLKEADCDKCVLHQNRKCFLGKSICNNRCSSFKAKG